jgi:cyclase
MPTMLHKDFGLVKGVRFDSWRRVGAEMQTVRLYNLRKVDELVLLDISASRDERRPDFELVDQLADECFAPLTVGGGITGIEDVRDLLMAGADKVALCSAAVSTPDLVRDIADRFGSQCVVVSIDVRATGAGNYEPYTHAGSRPTGRDAVDLAREVEASGAGEILLTSIDRDGTMQGYDLELTRSVCEAVEIPVIASGGCGTAAHMVDALRSGAAAVAAASAFHFTELTPLEAKEHLAAEGFPVRL